MEKSVSGKMHGCTSETFHRLEKQKHFLSSSINIANINIQLGVAAVHKILQNDDVHNVIKPGNP